MQQPDLSFTATSKTKPSIELRPATQQDRSTIYNWLVSHLQELKTVQSNVRIPTLEEFSVDYSNSYFTDVDKNKGRSFIICSGVQELGHICYHGVSLENLSAELDLWLKPGATEHSPECDTQAIQLLCNNLQDSFGCKVAILTPSRNNKKAISTYVRAGFILSEESSQSPYTTPQDAVILIKTIEK